MVITQKGFSLVSSYARRNKYRTKQYRYEEALQGIGRKYTQIMMRTSNEKKNKCKRNH